MPRTACLLVLLITLLAVISTSHAGLYRWVDDEGNVHYTDTIPPSQVTKGHTEINEGGVRVKSIPPAKTQEEIRKERELERLRAEQERLIEEQKAADRVLLQTFRSEDDIIMAQDGKITAIDVMIQVTRTNIRRHQQWLARALSEAANLERAGKPVPKHLSEGIAGSERSIHDAYGNILDRENQKDAVRARFGQDLERFRMLNNLTSSRRQAQNQTQDHGLSPVLHNIVPCGDAVECDRLWKKAETYVHEHATTIVQPGGSNILITDPPTSENDISLILARINDKGSNGAYLFLDLQCQGTIRGRPMCQSQEAKSIIEGFRPALTGEDASNP